MIARRPTPNRLISEKSPYLLQHAYNPVDWYPWGDDAIRLAQEENRPIFLSIGFASCHWCHVMERECFDNDTIAAVLNEAFVCIKVDREELPGVDLVYMDFSQALIKGAAGWPLNVFLTPDLKPFFAATYLPPYNKEGMVGFLTLIENIARLWDSEEKAVLIAQADKLVEAFSTLQPKPGDSLPDPKAQNARVEWIYKLSDPVWGGFKGTPKFLLGPLYLYLLRLFAQHKDVRALYLAERSLDLIQRGAVYDHLEGGFSRYSVDEKWESPHFEKMLYDNALMIDAYLEAYALCRKPIYRDTAEETIHYVLRVLKSPTGAFYASEDADSEGAEGAFYKWDQKEIEELLGAETGKIVCAYFGVTPKKPSPLHITHREAEFAENAGISLQLLEEIILEGKKRLLEARSKRERPKVDDKILVSWNGLMIHTLAKAALLLDKPLYLKYAQEAATFIQKTMFHNETLYRRFRDNDVRFPGSLDDYAFLIRGLLTLFTSGGGSEWLAFAIELTRMVERRFSREGGAFYYTAEGEEHLIQRKVVFVDGVEPSGNAVHCENLLRLNALTRDSAYLKAAEGVLLGVKEFVDNYPPGYTYHLMNLEFFGSKEAFVGIVALNSENTGLNEIKEALSARYNPWLQIIFKPANDRLLSQTLPYLESYEPIEGKTTFYLCFNGVSEKPLTKMSDIQEAILKLGQKV